MLSACDRCGDFIWNKPPGPTYCKGGPAPNSWCDDGALLKTEAIAVLPGAW